MRMKISMNTTPCSVRLLIVLCVFFAPCAAYACDPCAIYNVTQLQGLTEDAWSLSVAEQYTEYEDTGLAKTLRDGEILKGYSTTQFTLGYDISERIGMQATLPLISRYFDEVKTYRQKSDAETGIGDAAFLLNYAPVTFRDSSASAYWLLTAGIKVPTGDSGSLKKTVAAEEAEPEDEHLAEESNSDVLGHHQLASVSGGQGRALTLGSGSVDAIVGTGVFLRWERNLFHATAQYSFRTEGDFDYRFANDLVWSSAVGRFLLLEDEYSLALKAGFSGEHKGRDTFEGNKAKGSELSNVYAGPEMSISWGNALSGELGLDLPLYRDDTTAYVRPEYRIRANLVYRF